MEIVENQKDLEDYMRHAVKASPEHPVLVDSYLLGQECEVDAICDGETVLIPGLWNILNELACILVIQWRFIHRSIFLKKFKQQLPIIQKLALGLNCVGMMNIQFVIHENRVYVIEVNPRASRTVPFLSKITGIPMAQVATKAILGEKLTDLGYQDGLYPESKQVHVKAPVFSFTKLQK